MRGASACRTATARTARPVQQERRANNAVIEFTGTNCVQQVPPVDRAAFPEVQPPCKQRPLVYADRGHVHEPAAEGVRLCRVDRVENPLILGGSRTDRRAKRPVRTPAMKIRLSTPLLVDVYGLLRPALRGGRQCLTYRTRIAARHATTRVWIPVGSSSAPKRSAPIGHLLARPMYPAHCRNDRLPRVETRHPIRTEPVAQAVARMSEAKERRESPWQQAIRQ